MKTCSECSYVLRESPNRGICSYPVNGVKGLIAILKSIPKSYPLYHINRRK